jgi:hypothetical protein
MSATNRGADRIASDNYPTPAWATRRLLESGALPRPGDKRPRGAKELVWLEPCAGDGAIVRQLVNQDPARIVFANELRAESRAALSLMVTPSRVMISDYLAANIGLLVQPFGRADVIATNPPFDIAEAVVRKALTEAKWVAVLVRQGFMGHERAEWMRDDMPDTYDLPDRPQFAASVKCVGQPETKRFVPVEPCGWAEMFALDAETPARCPVCGLRVRRSCSDATDYCWLVWGPERGRKAGRRVILPSTPLAERKAQRVAA